MEEQADGMSGLSGDLLDAGHIGAGMFSVDPAPEALTELVGRTRTAFTDVGGRHAVVIDIAPDLPSVMADSRRIAQVLSNLFANAVRHSLSTSTIRVAAHRDGAVVEISVSDWGEGVSPVRLPHLFRQHASIGAGREGGGPGSGWSFARAWCRRTAGASAPTAPGRVEVRA